MRPHSSSERDTRLFPLLFMAILNNNNTCCGIALIIQLGLCPQVHYSSLHMPRMMILVVLLLLLLLGFVYNNVHRPYHPWLQWTRAQHSSAPSTCTKRHDRNQIIVIFCCHQFV